MIHHPNDRAAVIAVAVLQIIASTDDPDEQEVRLTEYLRDELFDMAQQIAAEREVLDA